jgi:hypothetical protein
VAKRPKDPNAPSRKDANERIAKAVRAEDRKARIEKLIFVVTPIVLVAIAAVIFFAKRGGGDGSDVATPGKGDKTYEKLSEIGVNPQIAGCTKPTNDPTPSKEKILPPGTKAEYPFHPPSSGPFLGQPAAINDIGFYTAADRPSLEALVANLNAGWSIAFYDGRVLGPKQVELIKAAAEILRKDPRYSQFAAVEWDASYGAFPQDAGPIGLTRWERGEREVGHRAYCEETSGEIFRQWMAAYGAAKIPGIDDV